MVSLREHLEEMLDMKARILPPDHQYGPLIKEGDAEKYGIRQIDQFVLEGLDWEKAIDAVLELGRFYASRKFTIKNIRNGLGSYSDSKVLFRLREDFGYDIVLKTDGDDLKIRVFEYTRPKKD